MKRPMSVKWTTAPEDGSCNNCCDRTGRILAIDIRCMGIRLCEACLKQLVAIVERAVGGES